MVVLGVLSVAVALISFGHEPIATLMFAGVTLVAYVYVLYKRYNVEVVPEQDIALFDDPEDLRILCRIYGLDGSGDIKALRKRLADFAKANRGRAFAWVAPRSVTSLGGAFRVEQPATRATATVPRMMAHASSEAMGRGALTGGRARSQRRLLEISRCPVCATPLRPQSAACSKCGADLEFYAVLSESKVGKRLVSAKSGAVRRKLRFEVPYLGEIDEKG